MKRTALILLLAVAPIAAAKPAKQPAPIEFRGASTSPPPAVVVPEAKRVAEPPRRARRETAPIEQKEAAPKPVGPRPLPAAEPPNWAAGPGTPLSVYALQPEEAKPFDLLALPPTLTVAEGDTLYAISARTQVPLRGLIDANALEAPFVLRAGQVLKLPRPRTVTVAKGDTLVSLAARYNVDARSLAYLNRMEKPFVVRPGETLVVPGLARPFVRQPAAPPNEPAPAAPKAKPSFKLAWPLKGKVLTKFGPQPGGVRSDGVDIAASDGERVKAAADGVVVYAGDDLPGYGGLVLVQHKDGWVTAYAQARKLVAKTGAKVHQGDVLAETGAKLHFQVRRGAEPTDPLAVLPAI